MFDMSHVNLLAILVAAIAGMAVGFAWYSKLLFMDQWAKLADRKMMAAGGNPLLYAANFLVYLVIAYAMAQVLYYFNLSGLLSGLAAGAFVFFGFAGSTAFTENLFSGRSWKLFGINYGYQLVNLLVIGVIIAAWR